MNISSLSKKATISVMLGIAMAVGVIGGSLLKIQNTNAQTTTPTQSQQPKNDQFDSKKGRHIGVNGVKEELLTGDTASKVADAAQASVSGGTVDRVETDAEGSPYEAHMTKSDGSRVTVKVDKSFKVTGVETGQGNHTQPNL